MKILPRIVTSADKNFYFFLPPLAKQVQKLYNKKLVIYDIGLTKEQRKSLENQAEIITLKIDRSHLEKDKNNFIKTTHKILIARDYIEREEPFILMDADCFPIERIYVKENFDLGLTRRHYLEIKPKLLKNGKINAGVIFFINGRKLLKLIDEWEKYCIINNVSDQKGLSEILDPHIDWKNTKDIQSYHGIKVKIFPAEIYNDIRIKTGKILHFKNAGRFEEDKLEYLNFMTQFQNPIGRAKVLLNILSRRAMLNLNLYYKKHKQKLKLLDNQYE